MSRPPGAPHAESRAIAGSRHVCVRARFLRGSGHLGYGLRAVVKQIQNGLLDGALGRGLAEGDAFGHLGEGQLWPEL